MRLSPMLNQSTFAAAALLAGLDVAAAQSATKQPTSPPELAVTSDGRVVPAAKLQDRVTPAAPPSPPSSVQMVFESGPVTPAASPGWALRLLCPTPDGMTVEAAEGLVRRIAEAERFYPEFVVAVARQESRFDVNAVSSRGAFGLMQLTPATAERFSVNLCDPEENIRGGIRYLRQLWERLRNPFYILAAYRAGKETVAAHRGVPPDPETVAFVAAVISDFYGYPPANAGLDAQTGPRATIERATRPPAGAVAGLVAGSPELAISRQTPAGAQRQAAARQPAPMREAPRRTTQPTATTASADWMVLHVE